jgi:AsmA-like C-terminal region
MYHLHLTRNLRSLVFLLVLAAILGAIGLLAWANYTGLPATWRSALEQTVAKQGIYLKIGSLRYSPLQGIVATDVRIFSEVEHSTEISRLERISLDFDKLKLSRGIFLLNKIEFSDARLALPLDPLHPDADILTVTDATGIVYMPGGRRLEVRQASGQIAGIKVTLDASILGYQAADQKPTTDKQTGQRRELIAKIIKELEKWQFDPGQPPDLRVSVEGDINDYSSIRAKVSLDVKNLIKNGHQLDSIHAQADIEGDLLTVSTLTAEDPAGRLNGHLDYDMDRRDGRFDVDSSLEVPQLLKAWIGLSSSTVMSVNGKQFVEAGGDFTLDEKNKLTVQATGLVKCESVTIKGVDFRSVGCAFSLHDTRLYIRDLKLSRADGEATGKALMELPIVRLQIHTTLPVPVYRPFFVGQPLGIVLNDFTEREGADVEVELEGSFDVTNRHAWGYKGRGVVKNLSYKGVPVNQAGCKFTLNHGELDFYDGAIDFDYTKYPLRKSFDGPAQSTAKVGRIRYDAPRKMIEVQDVQGSIWAAPMVRFFAPKVADSLEQYRFHRPPALYSSGEVDVTPNGRTALDITFSSEKDADYLFLGQNIVLNQPSGKVSLRGEKVSVSDLKTNAFEGGIAGKIDYLGSGKLTGDLNWTKLSLPMVTSTYGFNIKGGGTATGRLEFSLTDGKIETMAGKGLLAMERAELFAVPMFGPLSPLIGDVLKNDKAGFQRAKNAFFTFKIQEGVLSTQDFVTSTNSLTFTGDGSVNMKERTVDMTMRMNARGLLGIITLPLRPLSGLFQFHGTGPLHETKWEATKFTPTPESQNEELLLPPKAVVIPSGE